MSRSLIRYEQPGSTVRRTFPGLDEVAVPGPATVSRRSAMRGFAFLPAIGLVMRPGSAGAQSLSGSEDSHSASPGTVSAGSTAGGDLADSVAPDWMSRLADTTTLSALSTPGTHDSMACGASIFAATQDRDLPMQLSAGIRAIDIRCRHFRDTFAIHHDVEYLHANFADVVRQVSAFLRGNPGETILMRVKEEFTAAENTRTFESTLNWYIRENPETCDLLAEHLWTAPGGDVEGLPTLGAARGKIVVLQDFSATTAFGPRWGDPRVAIQDDYELENLAGIAVKWEKVRTYFERSRVESAGTFFVNHLSATGAGPAAWAQGTVPATVARGAPGVNGDLSLGLQRFSATTAPPRRDAPASDF
ncbi:phosphatidylinositol-specific phospholipase C [Rhodococcus sp. IEGM 1379]|uniref:phosphatidylinositol-specific phospholipase C n=1 Tax=Rhodococcus sp. IEGM 1379 TaxID=3047086 RepID=UPI0024B82EB0|nr:phosphatidylinositol-specific phospholipase C [Rhodococcus sp. IEGM 1379]MDI9915913.1 phosphatidylinositol-specific phospholipase C [Rhodococcus sp. IEGM 1379]